MFERILTNAQWRTRGVVVIVGIVFVFAIAALLPRGQDSATSGVSPTPSSAARSSASATPTATPTAVAAASPTPEPPAATPVATARPAPVTPQGFGNGTRTVGVDVAPGSYRTRTASAGCSWARLNAQGQLITGRSTDDPDIVTIVVTDGFFRSANCANWTLDLTRVTNTPLGPIFDGTFLVGTDIAPGVWRATSAGCSWWRLSEFTGDGSTIIAAGTSPNTTVTIIAADRGFRSINCSLWQKVG
jgi:hypothetical protein